MSEIKGCMNCGNISCGNNKKRDRAGCGRWKAPEETEKEYKQYEAVISAAQKNLKELEEKLGKYQKGMFDEIEKRDIKLTNAKEIILRLYNAGRDVLMCREEEKAYDNLSNAINDKSIEQFLSEVENV